MSAGKLPVDWKTVELGELIKLSTGKLDANAADNDGQYPFFTCAESVSQINSWAFDTSAVLLAGNGSFSIKKYTGKFNAYQRTYVIEPILIKTEFLYWLLRGNIKKITENGRGSTIPYIRKGDITDISVALPSPSEQTLIAEKLDTLLAQVDSTKARLEQIPQILKRFRQAVLSSAVSGKLIDKSFENKLEKLNSFVSIDIGNAFKSSEFSDEGVPLLRGQNIEPGALRWDDTKKFPIDKLQKYSNLFINEGDIILAMDRPIISSGLKIAKAKKSDLPCVLVQRVARFKDFENLIPDYLYLLLNDVSFINYIQPNQTGSDIPHISGKQILNFECNVPSLPEQHEIVRRVEQLFAYADTIEKQVNNALARVNKLTQSILAKAFRGELTAQWRAENPDLISGENSAAALLEKIKAERAASGGKKASRKKS